MIRVATADDLDTLVRLNAHVHDIHVAAHPERYGKTDPDALRGWFADAMSADPPGSCTFFVARIEGVDLGYLRGMVREVATHPFGPGRRDYEVDQLAVAPRGRQQGLGRALMRAAEDEARRLGCGRVELNVMAFNADARSFYDALGYTPLVVRLQKPLPG